MHKYHVHATVGLVLCITELVCCKKIKPGGKENTALEKEMEGSAHQLQQQDPEPQASEQWSLYHILAPLGQKLLQI